MATLLKEMTSGWPAERPLICKRLTNTPVCGEFPAGRGTGEVLRTGHETREAGLPFV